jgi:hypothetical protein
MAISYSAETLDFCNSIEGGKERLKSLIIFLTAPVKR